MPAKTPMYLKTTTPKRGKKLKLRDVLSGDMISPPLGDVRHSAHVGPEGEGDMFGDVGFLQGKLDMLPSLSRPQSAQGRSHSMERHLDDGLSNTQISNSYSYNSSVYHHPSTGLLKTTISMPVFVAHEQAPPKPPRLHLDDPVPPPMSSQFLEGHLNNHQEHVPHPYSRTNNHTSQTQGLNQNHSHKTSAIPAQGGRDHMIGNSQSLQQQQVNQHRSMSLCENGVSSCLGVDPCRDISYSPTLRRLVPSSGSFSEVSSEDSMSETCGPLDARQGLSLDSDAGLSNEDLRSDRSESPSAPPPAVGLTVSSPPSRVSRSGSLVGLNLDLGPSILEDVLSIMDRYKAVDDRCEL